MRLLLTIAALSLGCLGDARTPSADVETVTDTEVEMAVTAFYRSPGQAGDYAGYTGGLPALARAIFDGSGVGNVHVSLWIRAAAGADSGGAFVFEAGDGAAPSARVYFGGNGILYGLVLDDTDTLIASSEVDAVLDGQWHHIFVTITSGVGIRVYWDGAGGTTPLFGAGTFATPASKLTLFARHDGTFPLACDIAGFSAQSSQPSLGAIAALAAAGVQHDITQVTGAWTGVSTTHTQYWSTHAGVGGVVANTGLYGGMAYSIPLTFAGGVQSIPFAAETATAAVPRIGTIGKYPPVRTYYRTPGTVGSFIRAPSTTIPRLVFPDGGGLSSFAWRLWFRRPETPTTTGGTVGVITGGDASVTVTLDPTEHLVVTVDDGTNTPVTDTSAEPINGGAWYQLVFSYDADTDVMQGSIGEEMVVELDLSGLTFPDADTELTFTIGADPDGTSPIDADHRGIAFWESPLSPGEIADLAGSGPWHDPRNPGQQEIFDPGDGSPQSGIVWVEIGVDDVIPPATGDEPLIIIGEVESITEPSTFRIWTAGTHRIGAYSSAWWDNINPDDWSLSYVTAAHEDVFGECPRIIKVEFREEGDGVLWLYTDATLQPGIGYSVTGPNDLSGDAF